MRTTGWTVLAAIGTTLLGGISLLGADDKNKGPKIPAGAIQAFQTFSSGWESEDAVKVADGFPEKPKARIDVDNVTGEFSKEQAIPVLKKYFENVQVMSLELKDGKYQGNEESPIAAYIFKYMVNNRKFEAELLVACRQLKGGWYITHVSKGNAK